jgi:hypothetical protein
VKVSVVLGCVWGISGLYKDIILNLEGRNNLLELSEEDPPDIEMDIKKNRM